MPQYSIRTRLNLLIGALLLLALAANVVAIIHSAGPRIRAEDESIAKLTQQTVERALLELKSSSDPARDIATLLDRLTDVRHARVFLEPATPPGAPVKPIRYKIADDRVPRWFARLVYSDRPVVRVPATVGGQLLGTIIIASNPGDEIAEIWQGVTETATGGLGLIAAVFALTTFAVRQALMPIQDLGEALNLMQRGNYAVELATTGPPELAGISAKLNDLAAALTSTRRENSALAEQIISVEDQERRELARELHDEFGPYLFAIRANLSSLLARNGADDATRRACETTLEHVSALQQLNRRVLQRLRPPALAELGLDGALRGLVALWRENNPHVAITLAIDVELLDIDETAQLTVYRVVQEGLTNALRHAQATRIDIAVDQVTAGGPRDSGRLRISLQDNGGGLPGDTKPGFGLSGMSERVWALGGTMSMSNSPSGGLLLAVELPIAPGAVKQVRVPAT
jgi:two-component system, NarL family, sensor histidine kinase UhpB